MRIFRILFFLLISSHLFVSCGSVRMIGKEESPATIPLERFRLLDTTGEPLLFKARIHLLKNEFSGLFLLKEMPEDSSTRILFLSEIGLSLLDLRYCHDVFDVVSVQAFLDRPSVIRALQNDFRTLLLDLHAVEDFRIMETGAGDTAVLKCKHNSGRYVFHYREDKGVVRIRRRYGWFRKTDVEVIHEEGMKIAVKNSGIRFSLDLQKLDKLGQDDH